MDTFSQAEIEKLLGGNWSPDEVPAVIQIDTRLFARAIIEAEAGKKLRDAIEKNAKWEEPSERAGEGGFGPLFTSGLLMQYKADREKHERQVMDAVHTYDEAINGP